VAIGSTTTHAQAQEQLWYRWNDCPIQTVGPIGNDNTNPVITSISPDIVPVATTNIEVTINGAGFGSSPTVNLPQGVSNLGLSATNTQITVTISVSTNAPIGLYDISVTAGGLSSSPSAFTLDGAVEGVIVNDNLFHCNGCTTAWARKVTMQVKNFSGSNASNIFVAESASPSGWNCQQTFPGVTTENCGGNYSTDSNGYMADQWSVASDIYTPVGCGYNYTTHWQWCAAGSRTFLTLSGYTHTNAIDMNGVVNPPNQFTFGTVITP
jgi:hypothetical protein